MTTLLYQDDPYLRDCSATVISARSGSIVLDRTVFYPTGGGQPGDQGELRVEDGPTIRITDTRRAENGQIMHITDDRDCPLAEGARVTARLDWQRRYAHMRMHTCLHLLGAVVPYGVTGGNISATRSRLDFDMQETLDKDQASASLNALIEADLPVLSRWISQQELSSRPELVRTLSVAPPTNVPRIRLLEIPGIDLQPCGGTHVARTGEVGRAAISRVEKKGRHNRRVHVVLP